MKEKILAFFKDKFNIVLFVIQAVAIVCFCFSEILWICSTICFALEGVFFILLGIKILRKVKCSRQNYGMYNQLPYSEAEKVKMIKQAESANKNNKFIGVCLVVIGVVLLFSLFSIIF